MGDAQCIMVQGTGSNVGKSWISTALCRIFARKGYRTAPFKAQNMALNSAVALDGGEIGRAQAVQARAAGIQPEVTMNPILLKPSSDMCSQVVVMGRPVGNMKASEYRESFLPGAEPLIRECLLDLKSRFDVLVIEGAGSPAEVNLKDKDLVNMKTAEIAKSPVILVADIDRGGVFASLAGTLDLLEPHERARVKGMVINKFRGDLELLRPGIDFLEQRCMIPVLGVLPYINEFLIEEEDSLGLDKMHKGPFPFADLDIALMRLPRMANLDDFDRLAGVPGAGLRLVEAGGRLGRPDMVILPGSKNAPEDLLYMRQSGFEAQIKALAKSGTMVAGLCAGYHMLGRSLHDPHGIEGSITHIVGMDLLPISTVYESDKITRNSEYRVACSSGFWSRAEGLLVKGYEIHHGVSRPVNGSSPFLVRCGCSQGGLDFDGMVSKDGLIFGTHLHGFFSNENLLDLLNLVMRQARALPDHVPAGASWLSWEERLDRLADLVEGSLDMNKIFEIMSLD